VVIEATRMPFDRVKLHFTEIALYQDYEPEDENKILHFNPIAQQIEEEDDGEVVELERPFKIRRTIGLDGWVVYEFLWLKEGDKEDGEPNSLNLTQQPEEVHVAEEPMKEAPEYMNDIVKNV